jgi:hypothetical protein
MDKKIVDLVCVYCPDTRRCYYIAPRAHPTRNGQRARILLADDFTEIPDPLAQLD